MAPRVGILGYQGCIEPHEAMLTKLSVPFERVRVPEDLARVDRLIIPGGESTTMLRFLSRMGMQAPLREFAEGHPVWGVCAGAILMARQVLNPEQPSLDLIDIRAYRNFYGSQTDSFTEKLKVSLDEPYSVEAHFIRAPLLEPLDPTAGRGPVEVCARRGEQVVFLRQGRIWACSFHVELGSDIALHSAFSKL